MENIYTDKIQLIKKYSENFTTPFVGDDELIKNRIRELFLLNAIEIENSYHRNGAMIARAKDGMEKTLSCIYAEGSISFGFGHSTGRVDIFPPIYNELLSINKDIAKIYDVMESGIIQRGNKKYRCENYVLPVKINDFYFIEKESLTTLTTFVIKYLKKIKVKYFYSFQPHSFFDDHNGTSEFRFIIKAAF